MRLTRKEAQQAGIHVIPPKVARKRTQTAKVGRSAFEAAFKAQCVANGLPEPVPEFEFAIGRKWKFDWLFQDWLAVEQVGGVWIGGHHSRGQSQIDDMGRRNEAVILGYSVLEFTPKQMGNGEAIAVIKRALGVRP